MVDIEWVGLIWRYPSNFIDIIYVRTCQSAVLWQLGEPFFVLSSFDIFWNLVYRVYYTSAAETRWSYSVDEALKDQLHFG